MRAAWIVLAAATALALIAPACKDDSRDFFVVPFDGGQDAPSAKADANPEVDPTLGGPCTDDAQCDNLIPCTFDSCDKTLSRCRNVPDDAQCDDHVYCNGKERCVLRQGCAPGPVVTCADGDNCTILDRYVEASHACEHFARDSDGDGNPDGHCSGGHDCDDTNPTVSASRVEICNNFKDDNCNGEVDEEPCSVAAYDTCATALAVTAPGTFLLSTQAAREDYATSCTVATPAAARDIVVAITVPASGPEKDVLVSAETSAPVNEVAVAIESTCGASGSELACGAISGARDARAIARRVAPGATVYAIVTTQSESALDVRVDFLDGSTKPANESCGAPVPVTPEQAFTVSLVDPTRDLPSSCENAKTGELTYSFTLATPRDVRIFASTTVGSGTPVVSMRADSCFDELRCRSGTSPPVFARNLQPGTHVFSVAGTTQIDASVVVRTFDPTPTPANGSCATAPLIAPNTTFPVNLTQLEDSIPNGCFPGKPAAAYRLDLDVATDVLVVGRFPSGDSGGVSLNKPGCGTADRLDCAVAGSPTRVFGRNLAAGSYRIVISDSSGQPAELSVYTRPSAAPQTVTADDCTSAFTIPPGGGFFTGDTSALAANFDASCDASGQPLGGAKDSLLRLDLPTRKHVVFDMSGSTFSTLLNLRKGNPCPGVEVPNSCVVDDSGSFLDSVLDPGTYWVQVDGYDRADGEWNLGVNILEP